MVLLTEFLSDGGVTPLFSTAGTGLRAAVDGGSRTGPYVCSGQCSAMNQHNGSRFEYIQTTAACSSCC